MSNSSGIAQMQVEELIEAIGGKGLAAGAGAAGAVTLALAAACAAKAVAISINHQPANATLLRSREILEKIARVALAGADRDAEAFATLLKEHSLDAVTGLLREGDRIMHLIDLLAQCVDTLGPQVEPNMAGDLTACRALMEAARKIQLTNSAQAQAQKARITAPDGP